MRLGLAALRHLQVVDVAMAGLVQLRDEIGFTVGLAVWGNHGPTFVRMEETSDILIISTRPGSGLPMLNSATGRVFGAYLPASLTQPFIAAELQSRSGIPGNHAFAARGFNADVSGADVETLFDSVRAHGLANVTGDLNPGIHGIAAPIFDHVGGLAGVITAMGAAGLFDASLDGPVAQAVKAKAAEISVQMGHR